MKSKTKNVLGIILLIPVLLLVVNVFPIILFVSLMAIVGGGLCDNELVTSVSSSQYEATLYNRNCGATTDFVGVVKVDNKKVFSANHYRTDQILLKWVNDSKLQIEYSGSPEDIFINKNSYKNVDIDLIQKELENRYW